MVKHIAGSSAMHARPCRPTVLAGHTHTTPSKLAIHYPVSFFSSSTRANGSFLVRALDPEKKQEDQKESNLTAFTSQEDLGYLWKLGAGSILGGAVIKYGSAIFPGITKPNLALALLIILSPVFVAVWLLINQSRREEPN